ncbi:uncharacterized protein LOC126995306, partial [Eriocheir sinensis]|uniref:uncharacterized protein LOC126995306 n=1 Tax=Eriocheir sinensis TaxID=95602 RepID=UPI0021C889D9
MPLVYCGRGGASKLLPLTDDHEVETSEPVTYCVRAGGEAGPGGVGGGGALPDPPRRHSSASFCLEAACCHGRDNGYAEPSTGLYALLGLSRCWWLYTVTSSPAAKLTADAMEEGVATEERGGAGPEVTGVGWSLPCSLSSLLAMNCRARAEGLARRLQAKVRLGGGGPASFEQTSLVSPGPEDHYASMECRHSSLDDPHLDLLEGSSLRPIHVVTSEPTLHLCPPTQHHLVNLSEQDSDVYYDFDLASPDEAAEADADEEARAAAEEMPDDGEQRRPSEGGERPESGCVTSVTSPVMFDDERDDEGDEGEEGPGGAGELHAPEEALACSPDADLRAVRQILSYSSLSDAQNCSVEAADENCVQNGECAMGGRGGAGCSECGGVGQERAGQAASGTEGASDHGDTCPRRPAWAASPVARSGSCWCHHAPGTPPAVPRTSAGRLACYASPTLYQVSSGSDRCNGRPSWGLTGSEACQAEHCVMIDNEGHNKDDQGHHDTQSLSGEGGRQPPRTLSPPAVPQDACPEAQLTDAKQQHDGAAADREEEAEDALKPSPDSGGGASEAISGSWPPPPPPPAELHLYPTSAADTEAKGADDAEADLPPAEGEGGLEEDTEVIETLDEDEEASCEEEANEEDIEEETILTGKFRNIRGYKERVRRLSEEAEDAPPPVTVVYYEDDCLPEQQEVVIEQAVAAEKEPVSGPELASQLSELTVEDVGVQVDEAEAEPSSDEAATRSSSEETDSERIEDY